MTDLDWLRSTFSGHFFSVMDRQPLQKRQPPFLKQNSKTKCDKILIYFVIDKISANGF
jgi:hypothetical protein